MITVFLSERNTNIIGKLDGRRYEIVSLVVGHKTAIFLPLTTSSVNKSIYFFLFFKYDFREINWLMSENQSFKQELLSLIHTISV